ncbi:MAG: NADH dehydrogenase subunit [Candidatus Altiarchaeota archaeon]|nr:NADH dehydrogenase subunit [Candidatus Altiarchaeota archaeon]
MPRIEIPFGPYHPALGEPEYFQIIVEGETVVAADLELGYNYREIETKVKSFTWPKAIVLLGRICGICSSAHTQAFAYSVEAINKLAVPKKALFIRTIGAELERLHSHLLWLGLLGEQAGFDTLFMLAWGARENALTMLEQLAGKRIHYNYMAIGGVSRDLPATTLVKMKKQLAELKAKYADLKQAFITNEVLASRLKGIGKISKELAIEYGVVGPTARGSGVRMVVRKDTPYSAYGELDFDVPIAKKGDSWSRAMVRLEEIGQSIHILEQAFSIMPKSRVRPAKTFYESKQGKATAAVEAPRGEDFHFVIAGKLMPKLVRVRAPTFANLAVLPEMLKGQSLSDVPVIINSIDPCFACTDRVTVIDKQARTIKDVCML